MDLRDNDLICKYIEFANYKCGYIAVPASSNDPIVKEYLDNRAANDYMLTALAATSDVGDLVIDLGCHVGTFSIGAALMERGVIAVDANPKHVDWVTKSGHINGFKHFVVINKAITADPRPVKFDPNGLFGAIDYDGRANNPILVETARLDAIVSAHARGRRIAFLKMDIEGAELEALQTAGKLLRKDAPVIWFESNGMTLEKAGTSVPEFRSFLEKNDYKVFRVENEAWIYAPPSQIQPEAWVDMIALSSKDQRRFADRLKFEWDPAQLLERCEFWAALPYPNTKVYLANEILRRELPSSVSDRLQSIARKLQTGAAE